MKYGLEDEIRMVGKLTGQNHWDEPNCRPISSAVSEGLILKANTT